MIMKCWFRSRFVGGLDKVEVVSFSDFNFKTIKIIKNESNANATAPKGENTAAQYDHTKRGFYVWLA